MSTSAVSAIPCQDVLSAYVGRLLPDTTEEQLSAFLANEGRKLEPKNGMMYRAAAFHVICSKDSDKFFYHDNCWPEGVDLRDRVYKQAM